MVLVVVVVVGVVGVVGVVALVVVVVVVADDVRIVLGVVRTGRVSRPPSSSSKTGWSE